MRYSGRAMDAEAATYARELHWVLGQICVALKGLTPAQLTWRPDTGAANSAYAIAHHVAEVTRVYALGFGCAQPVTRDRSTEFSATADDAGVLIARLEALATEIAAREALVERLRHAGVHLGELRLTRDLALRHA